MDVLEAIKERRSIRKYKPDPISDEMLGTVLEAVRWSPSWANTQCWEVIVIREPEIKAKVAETLPPGNPALSSLREAPVLLVLCALAAHSLGLGTVMVGLFDAKEVENLLGVPENVSVVAMTPLGYAQKEVSAPRRKELVDFVHFETYRKSRGT
jgi:nitroreductase